MTSSHNVWENFEAVLQSGPPYVLETDRVAIENYNKRQKDLNKRVFLSSIPEPFIGNPETARLVLLNLNPGHSDDDEQDHQELTFRAALIRNLKHSASAHPFYPLDPTFKLTGAGRWWRPLTQTLLKATGLTSAQASERILVIEWFPYHSPKSGLRTKQICSSQTYSFELAKRMIQRSGTVVLGMRSRKHWVAVSPRFENIPFLLNKQRPFITPKNMPSGLFEEVVALLKAP